MASKYPYIFWTISIQFLYNLTNKIKNKYKSQPEHYFFAKLFLVQKILLKNSAERKDFILDRKSGRSKLHEKYNNKNNNAFSYPDIFSGYGQPCFCIR